MSERDEIGPGAVGVLCCCLNFPNGEGDKPEILCGDPECDGKVHWVHDRYELACKRSDGIPGNFGSDAVAVTPRKERP